MSKKDEPLKIPDSAKEALAAALKTRPAPLSKLQRQRARLRRKRRPTS